MGGLQDHMVKASLEVLSQLTLQEQKVEKEQAKDNPDKSVLK